MVELVEIAPGRWRVKRAERRSARSDLPLPYVISDIMEPTEQVDGKFYTSKRQFRAVGKALDLIEVGNEKPPPKVRASKTARAKSERINAVKTAIERVRAGERTRSP